jgi:hypothetical protein
MSEAETVQTMRTDKRTKKRSLEETSYEVKKKSRTENWVLKTLPIDVCLHILSFHELKFFAPLCFSAQDTIKQAVQLYHGKFIDRSFHNIQVVFPHVSFSHGEVERLENQKFNVDIGLCAPKTITSLTVSNAPDTFTLRNLRKFEELEEVVLESSYSQFAFDVLNSAPNLRKFSFRNTPEFASVSMMFGPFGLKRIIQPISLEQYIPRFKNLRELDLVGQGTSITSDDAKSMLMDCPNLTAFYFRLYVKMNGILALFGTSTDIQEFDISAHQRLASLQIRCDQYNIMNFKPCPSLHTLVGIGINYTDPSLVEIFKQKNLKTLILESGNETFGPEIVDSIYLLTKLKKLSVGNDFFWSEPSIREAVKSLPSLSYLQIDGNFGPLETEEIYSDLFQEENRMFKNLNSLLFDGPYNMTVERMTKVLENGPNLSCLSMRQVMIEEGCTEVIRQMGAKMKTLAIGGSSITDKELLPFMNMTTLENLFLYNCDFSHEAADTIMAIPKLHRLELYSGIGEGIKTILRGNDTLQELHYNGNDCTIEDVLLVEENKNLMTLTVPIGDTLPANTLTKLNHLIEINAEERVNLPPQSYDYDSENSAEYKNDPVDYLVDYGVTNGDIGKLREGGFYTVGQVQDASEQDLKRIRGIGKVKAARIKDAVDRYSEEEGDDFF